MKIQTIFVFGIILLLSILSMAAWLYEIVYRIGWFGLNWLGHEHLSVFVIIAAVVLAYLLPFEIIKSKPLSQIILPFIILFVFSLLAYYFIKYELAIFYSRYISVNRTLLFLQMLTVPYFVAYGFYFVSKQFLLPVQPVLRWQMTLGIILVIPLSLLSVRLYDGLAPAQHSFVDAVKMGYPFFWITFVMGVLGYIAVKQAKEEALEKKEDRPDILDDLF